MKGFIQFAVMVMLAGLPHGAVQAQEAFTTVSLAVRGGDEVGRGRFQRLWSTSPSIGLAARMPFHVGDVEIGAAGMRNTHEADAGGDFTSALLYVGWGRPIVETTRIRWRGALQVADYLMVFDDPPHGYAKRENELGLGAETAILIRVRDRLDLEGGTRFTRVFTVTPLDLWQVFGGVRYRFAVPEWLRTLLR